MIAIVKNHDLSPPIEAYHPPPPKVSAVQENQLSPASNPDFLRPIPHNERIPQRGPQYQEVPEYNAQMPQIGWNPHQSSQIAYPMPPVYPGQTSHIFNHKENGLQVPEAEISPYGESGNYPKIQNYYGDNYRQPVETPNWVNAHQDDLKYPSRYNQGPPSSSYNSNNNGGMEVHEENPEHVQLKMAQELEHSKASHDQPAPKEEPKIKIIEKPPEARSNEYPDVVAYKMDGNDGVAQTPGGAVLSLTLGLIITCIMAIMIGCRLRIVKRRIRKGGKGYAHDADYLVNGMYL
ncbi:hypothetical protein HHI36_007717 [Cryptolaemus montrouzieri]|uniref:Uncharacterized protein n=1 Tax=Cryptolaemus montrouzieri TaxID=559131 RepID=A0ABD2MQC7_9CUCU